MKETKSTFKEIFFRGVMRGCTLAVCIILAFFLIMSAVSAAMGTTEQGMNFSSMITLVIFSLVISFAAEILNAKSLTTPAKWAVNFVVVGVAYFFVVLRSSFFVVTGESFYVVGMILYVIVYAAIAGTVALVHRIRHRHDVKDDGAASYTGRFS